ncbi:hypothetical protein [Chiayiivirga flava]|uniref:Glycosyltransferase RgtA/B/C/D-like domain-containing protein n=1 Tax=Chiayiivirga flava TaxID=659595 RepID=A0A7W8D3Q5_9GAMM|nr:hypothetical protein [Chiayiivirga flava]MBB5207329.1 hypothetical protein [Chiayiivirga flava]
MNVSAALLALLLPWAAGGLLCRLLFGARPAPGRACIAVGAGFLVGCTAWGMALRWYPERGTTEDLFAATAGWLAGIVLLGGLALLLMQRRRSQDVPDSGEPPHALDAAATRRRRTAWAVALLVAAFGVLIVLQSVALPALAWDAWNAWFAKAKGWYFAGHLVPPLPPRAWLAATPGSGIAVLAAHYPDTLPRLAVWMASASGGWHEPAVHLLWPGAWLALGLALFGLQRRAGVDVLPAVTVAGFVLTLPLVLAHATLAGYADLWVAAMLLVATAQAEQWLRTRRWQDAALALLAAALLPALKHEGAIWFACLGAAVLLAQLPRRGRWIALAAALAVFAISLPFGGLSLPLPGLGWVTLGWGVAVVPGLGTLDLHWRAVTGPVLESLFLRENWNLLWYAAPLVLWFGRGALRQPSVAALGWFFAFGFAFLFVLFFFTDASRWAQNLTSLNRIVLQMVPALVFWLSLLWRDRNTPSDTPRPSPH